MGKGEVEQLRLPGLDEFRDVEPAPRQGSRRREAVLPQEGLGRLHLVGQALVLGDAPDQPEDGRSIRVRGR